MAALWTEGDLPPEYTDLVLMRDVFHCTPAELAAQDADAVLAVLTLLQAETAYEKRKAELK